LSFGLLLKPVSAQVGLVRARMHERLMKRWTPRTLHGPCSPNYHAMTNRRWGESRMTFLFRQPGELESRCFIPRLILTVPTLTCGRRHREASVPPPATGPQLHTPCPLPRVDKKEHWLCKAASSPSPSGPSWNGVSVIAKEDLLCF